MSENERLKKLLKEVVTTFETAFKHSDLLKRIRLELGIDPPWYVKQYYNKDEKNSEKENKKDQENSYQEKTKSQN